MKRIILIIFCLIFSVKGYSQVYLNKVYDFVVDGDFEEKSISSVNCDSTIIMLTSWTSSPFGNVFSHLYAINYKGDTIWSKDYTDYSVDFSAISSLHSYSDSSFIVSGYIRTKLGKFKPFISEIHKNGTVLKDS